MISKKKTKIYAAFDIGNVLCHVDFAPFINAISKEANITKAEAWEFLGKTQKTHDLGLSVIKEELQDRLHFRSEVLLDEMLKLWDEAIRPEKTMFGLLDDLVANGVELAILSNIGPEHATFLEQYPNPGEWNGYRQAVKHFSYLVGARKSSMLYYQSFLLQHPQFKGAVFIDDLQPNLTAAEGLGFRTRQFSLDALKASNHNWGKTLQAIEKSSGELKKLILG